MFDLPVALKTRANAGNLSHAYILTGPGEAALEAAAWALAAAYLCEGSLGARPCGRCKPCKKVEKRVHPDVKVVAPQPGKDILVAQIRELRGDAYIRPNEGERKVYLIQDAHRMNPSAQNALLKVLEEGPKYAAFLLLTPNDAALLPTIRSRCEVVRVVAAAAEISPEIQRKGQELAGLLLGKDKWALISWSVPMEKLKREEIYPILSAARDSLLTYRTPKTTPQAVSAAQGLGEIIADMGRNLGVGAVWSRVWTLQG